MNYFKEAEEVLRRLPKLEKALEMLYKQKEHIEKKKNSPKGFKSNSVCEVRGSSLKKEVFEEICEYTQCLERISDTKFEIDRIKSILTQIDREESDLLELWYIKNENKENIKYELNISSLSTLYDLRNRSVLDFALYYFGVKVIAHIFKGLKGMVKMARLEEIDKDLDENGVVLAKDIDDCSNCPLYESECHGLTSNGAGNPIEPPCTFWNDDDEIWDGMLELQRLEWEEYEERQKKRERSMKAKKAAETRKRYAHLDDKYAKFKEWLPKSQWRLIITSRRLNRVYMRAIGKRSANYYFDLQKEKFHIVRGNVSLLDKNTMNRFENNFKEMFYGVRPKDRDFVKEIQNKIAEMLKEFEVF